MDEVENTKEKLSKSISQGFNNILFDNEIKKLVNPTNSKQLTLSPVEIYSPPVLKTPEVINCIYKNYYVWLKWFLGSTPNCIGRK